MCGIAVAVDWDDAVQNVHRLIGGILHRGDVTDPLVTVGESSAMCTRRLRIVDAAHGVQPQASFDDRFLVSFNGEIYNHAELRRELSAVGVRFRTECDTEVVANALRVWGLEGIERLSGMYAFVAVDVATGEFLAARDPFGVKPLYFVQKESPRGFLFCSEIRPLLDTVDDGDVLLLPPGCILTRSFCRPHYKLPQSTKASAPSPRDLDRILSDAVRARLPSRLPFTTLFSGGIDSTLIVHYARRFDPDMPAYIAAGPAAPDYVYARRYADDTGLDLREVRFDPTKAATPALVEAVVETIETFEPAVVRPSIQTCLLSKRIHEDGFRVALCGEGADELFAGYEPLEDAFTASKGLGRHLQSQCLAMMHRANLQRVDRCSMRFQLEIREPFLDQSVVKHAFDLKETALLKSVGETAVGKAPLRALYDLYPSELPTMIRDRQKMLFHRGGGVEIEGAAWTDLFETAVSDVEFREGRREFANFSVSSKEELFYIRALAAKMNIRRIPHLRGRLQLQMPRAA